jgi:hypothetical protein
MWITPLSPSHIAGGRVTWVKSQWKSCAKPGHFSAEINSHHKDTTQNRRFHHPRA